MQHDIPRNQNIILKRDNIISTKITRSKTKQIYVITHNTAEHASMEPSLKNTEILQEQQDKNSNQKPKNSKNLKYLCDKN